MAKNISKVYLLNTPLEKDYNHTLYFANEEAQLSYFLSKQVYSMSNCSYQRENNTIRFNKPYDDVISCNYVMYQNPAYNSKWFYAFITDVKWVSDAMCDISIETDVIQTWYFKYNLLPSFIEREHVKDDTIGIHTLPENLEKGDYIINSIVRDPNLAPSPYIVMGSSVDPTQSMTTATGDIGGNYNGIYSGVRYYAFSSELDMSGTNVQREAISRMLQKLTDAGKEDAVSSVFMAPKFLIYGYENKDPNTDSGGEISEKYSYSSYNFQVPKRYGLDGYTPKNNKLKTYPYCYLLASNGNGGVAEYRYEYFEPDLPCDFVVCGALTPGCSIRMVPAIYKGVQMPETEGLNLGKFPQCNWATDQYTNWLTQNGTNVATNLIGSVAGGLTSIIGGIAGGYAVGNIPGAIIGGIAGVGGAINSASQIANTLQEKTNAEKVPPQTHGNTNCGDVVTSMGNNTFTYYNMSIKKEYAEIIDKYFDMYGYQVNIVKQPNMNHRENYWYIKTINVNINANEVIAKDLLKIKEIYNKGITFWKNPTNIRNYSVSNNIVE